jgi:uncharacterized membrane protein HdeD (DUF308 family)
MRTDTSDRADRSTSARPDPTERARPGPLGPVLRREAGRWWWAPVLAGVAWFIIAWAVLRADVTSLATVGVLVGGMFLIAAVNEAALGGFLAGGWRFAHYLLAGVFVAGAAWAFVRPVDTFFALASALGLILFLQGAMYIVLGIGLRDQSPYWALQVISGVLITALAIWVSVSDQVWNLEARSAFILLWVGFMAVCRGVSDMVIGFTMLGASKHGSRESTETAADGTAPPYIPDQERRSPAGIAQPDAPSTSRA